MNILLTNDDGYGAPGLEALAAALREEGHHTFVVAPERERSAMGHAITLHKPLHVIQHHEQAWAVSGTPVDCVKLAMHALVPCKVDLVVSGINRGANLGTDVYYSGTVSAAIEGLLQGVSAMAFSLVAEEQFEYEDAAWLAAWLVGAASRHDMGPRTLLNVNVPSLPRHQWRGVRVCELGVRHYQDVYDRRLDPRGRIYYWLGGAVAAADNPPGSDVEMVARGFVSVTPLRVDLTRPEDLERIAGWGLTLPSQVPGATHRAGES